MRTTIVIFLYLWISSLVSGQAFVSEWQTKSNNESITITINPDVGSSSVKYNVDWGDGATDTNVTGDISHNYVNSGSYTVQITDQFPGIIADVPSGNAQKLVSISQWGNIQWVSMENAFQEAVSMNITASDAPDLSNVTNCNGMFSGCKNLNANIGNWNMSNVALMNAMFSGATNFNQSLGNWNTQSVTNMGSMFKNASTFNQDINTPTWKTDSVINMSNMFEGAIVFNQPLSNWNVSHVTDMSWMFRNATAFNQNINDWEITNAMNLDWMFYNATSYNQPMDKWNLTSVTSINRIFTYATSFNQDVGGWDTQNVTDMGSAFFHADSFNYEIGSWDLSSADGDQRFILQRSGMSVENYDSTLIGWRAQEISNINIGWGNPAYCRAQVERQELIDDYGWTIGDDGQQCDDLRPCFITNPNTRQNSGNWSSKFSWSLNKVPMACHEVLIPTSRNVDLDQNGRCFTLEVEAGGTFTVDGNYTLDVWVD